jgi:hypothetical protein
MVNHRPGMPRLWNEKKPPVQKDTAVTKPTHGDTLTAVLEQRTETSPRTLTVTEHWERKGVVIERTVTVPVHHVSIFVDPLEDTLRTILTTMSDDAA